MTAFLKSDLFLRFLGGFAVGSAAMFALAPGDPPALTSPAIASISPASTTTAAPSAPSVTPDRAAL